MKIGILTRRDGYNIGTSLQAYAMQHVISKLGVDYKILDYCEYSKKARLRYFILNCLGVMSYLFTNSVYRKGYNQRIKFNVFDKKLNKTTKKFYYKIDSSINKEFDAFICGSDQIWNPSQLTPAFLLNFVDNNKRKIAYAPSIGVARNVVYPTFYVELMNKFDCLSCREIDGAKVIEQITNKTCHNVLDPTLLVDLNEWHKLEKAINIPDKYILCYFLGDNNYPVSYVKSIAEKFDYKILNVRMFYNLKNNVGEDLYVSPDEFLFLIKNAELVCTNSYHGTIFSIIYRKLFYVFKRNYKKCNYDESSRFDSLFSALGLNIDRISIEDTSIPYSVIDYNQFPNNLDELKEESIKYLYEAIGDLHGVV